jgi:outer membrane protein OmpA-like peptidoglycan-associated protein
LLAAGALCSALVACGGIDPNIHDDADLYAYDIDDVRSMAPQGAPFTQGLRSGYLSLADSETVAMGLANSRHFQRKAVGSAKGQAVQPDFVSLRTLSTGQIDELTAARARLMAGLDGGGRQKAPAAAARAQTSFDCWLAFEESNDAAGISACKKAFEDAMAEVERALATDIGNVYLVFFAWDRADVTPVAATILDQVAQDYKDGEIPRVVLAGHTDTSGTADYNLRLSERRARAIAAELVARGVPETALEVTWFGETELRVPTADGVREPQNRRVEILFAD